MPNARLEYQVKKLKNGLTCLYVPLDTPGSACSNIVYNIGSANERPGEFGLSHLLEHGMHFGSKNFNANTPGGVITDMELKSAIENATTSFYRTNYFLVVPVQYLKDVIVREADRMRGLDVKLFAERLDKECTVVLNEMEIGQTNDMRLMMNALNRCAFQIAPNGHSTIGKKHHLFAAVKNKGATLLAYHKRSYTPDNATLVLAGPFNQNTTTIQSLHNEVETAFGDIASGCTDLNKYEDEPPQLGMRSFTIPGESTMFVAAFRGPPGVHEDSVPMCALARVLKYRLEDLENKNICMQTEVMWDRAKQSSLFSSWCVGFQNAEVVRNAVMEKIEELRSNVLVTKDELAKAKKELLDAWTAQLQSSQGVADAFTEAVAMGNTNDVNTKFDELEKVTPAQLTAIANRWLIETGTTIGLMYPYEVNKEHVAAAKVPELKSVGTKTFANVLHAPHFSIPSKPDAQQLAPSAPSPTTQVPTTLWKRPGMVHFSVTFTPKVDVDFVALSMMNANKNPQISWDATGPGSLRLTFACQPKDFKKEDLKLVWGDPKEYAIAGEKGQMMKKGITYDINKYAEKLMQDSIFDVPSYSHSFAQAIKIVKESPRKVVAVAPDTSMLHTIQNFFHSDKEYKEYVPKASASPVSRCVSQNKTSIKVLYGQALPGIDRSHKDFIPLNIATAILGYGFHGMLMSKVRMHDGLTYGIESHLTPGALRIGATFPPRNVDRGVQDIKSVLQDWKQGITQKEVDIQKQRLKLMPITLSDKAENFVKAQHTFLDKNKIEACSYEDVLSAFDKHINIDKLVEIRVG